MKSIIYMATIFILACPVLADETAPDKRESKAEERAAKNEAGHELSGAEKRQLEEEVVAELLEEHNATVDDEMDEVICEKRQVTGSRRKIRVCKTRREIEADKEATQRLMRERTRRGSSPQLPRGMGGGEN